MVVLSRSLLRGWVLADSVRLLLDAVSEALSVEVADELPFTCESRGSGATSLAGRVMFRPLLPVLSLNGVSLSLIHI